VGCVSGFWRRGKWGDRFKIATGRSKEGDMKYEKWRGIWGLEGGRTER
jgi:hypothetical protein